MNEFSYQEFWALEEPMQRPHRLRADELGISVDDIPVSPVLTKFEDSLRRIEEMYNIAELEEEGVDVEALLNQFTEMQVTEYLENMEFEAAISFGEIESLLFCNDWSRIIQIPWVNVDFFLLRQFEESATGSFVDVSAFNTIDFLRTMEHFEFDKYRYFTDKVAEKVMDMAIMHSCISNTLDKEQIKQRFISYVNQKYRDYALKLLEIIKNIDDEIKKAELMEKMQERNRQIRRLRSIWKKYAYWS